MKPQLYIQKLVEWCEANGLSPSYSMWYDIIGYNPGFMGIDIVFEINNKRYVCFIDLDIGYLSIYNVALNENYNEFIEDEEDEDAHKWGLSDPILMHHSCNKEDFEDVSNWFVKNGWLPIPFYEIDK